MSIVVIDRGYTDYKLFSRWTEEGTFFVSRLKDNAQYRVIERRSLSENSSIIADQIIRMTGYYSQRKCPYELRRITVYDHEHKRYLVFLTNHTGLAASTIARVYKDRWEIEIFFKIIKQHLKIKTFVSTSPNAVKIQIWTALIAILLVKY